ncbi:uncharacterized protein [Canis lupus baileyi]|uniref:uncharacterized protein isoform X4 n=1 Tax=Canis lupus baileyi TaxID=143281 RepID=UPI003B96F563
MSHKRNHIFNLGGQVASNKNGPHRPSTDEWIRKMCKLKDVFWDQTDGGDTFRQTQVQATAQDPPLSSDSPKRLRVHQLTDSQAGPLPLLLIAN